MALSVVGAERGMILLRDAKTDSFTVRLSRNLEDETVQDGQAFSRSIVAQAGEGRSILAIDAGSDERFRDLRSVSLFKIRSLMCVPLRSRGKIVGTVYLDSRRKGKLFTKDDLRFLEAFADHASLALENVRTRARLEKENRRLLALAEERSRFDNIVGRSPAMQDVYDLIERVAQSDLPVLIHGESGTGKELVARAIHFHSPRKRRVLLSENCASIAETLLESELFGHVRGAFTGAERDRPGLFEQADGGTLFLDEVGDMSPGMQARLLRVLEDGEVRRVGGEETLRVDVRVIAATHRDLQELVAEGSFREDLLYRLQVLAVPLPPLRERPGDVPLLVGYLLDRISRDRGRDAPIVDPDVMEMLERYTWPGNVRQLENALQRLALLAGTDPVTRSIVESDPGLRRSLIGAESEGEPLFSLERNEREQIRRALEASGGNRNKAARMLGISRATIYRKIKEYRLR
jgi:transcriptional regulator with GAF, ATPase, and Fis domain